jgi:flagellar operon protein
MSSTIINGVSVPFLPVGGVDGLRERTPFGVPEEGSFKNVLDTEIRELKFSRHAQERLQSRNIQLSDQDKSQLSQAVSLAGEKGSQESLVFLKDMAFIVNVKNRTVVTAIDQEHLKQNVFTNIDSAIVAS